MDSSGVFHNLLYSWETSIQNFRREGVAVGTPHFKFVLDPPSSSKYTLDEQCTVISSIPNNHYWNEGTHAHVGYNRMLSVRDITGKYQPASLRNLIMMNHRESNYHYIFKLVDKFRNPESAKSIEAISGNNNPITETDHLESNVVNNTTPRTIRPRRKPLTEQDIISNLRHVNPRFLLKNRASEDSLYDQYRTPPD